MANQSGSDDDKKRPKDEHSSAADKAGAAAARVAPGMGVPGQTISAAASLKRPLRSSNANIESLKKVILSNQAVREDLAAANDEEDFIQRLAALSVQHGVAVSAADLSSHMKDMARHLSDSEDDIPSPSPSPSGCNSPNTASGYTLNCGFQTQTCLCTI
jgi:hypothetical protein